MERLIHFLNRLRHSVTIRVEPTPKPTGQAGLYVAVA